MNYIISEELRDKLVSGLTYGFGPGEQGELRCSLRDLVPIQSGDMLNWSDLASQIILARGRHMDGRNLDEPGKEKWGEDEYVAKELMSWLTHLQQAPQAVEEWISVTDRLPGSETWALIHCEFGIQVDLFVPGHGWETHGKHGVTHWQPLPPDPVKVNDHE